MLILLNLNFGNNPGKEYYDKTIFTEAGLDPEAPPATWDELEQYAERIVEKTGKYDFDMAVKETTPIFCVFLLGGGW